jgi:hypothetical protein
MKPMKLADVRKHTPVVSERGPTGRWRRKHLDYIAACKLANPGDPFLRNMAIALSLHSWSNTAQEWQRLEAALVILAHKRAVARQRRTT